MARIGIDARFLGPEGTGIGRYVEKLLENLELLDSENEYFVFLRKNNFPLYNPKKENFHKITADAHWYSLKEQIIMPAVLSAKKLDLVHFPHFNIPLLWRGKFVVTIHDLTLSKFDTSKKLVPFRLGKKMAYQFTINQAVKNAAHIITPTNFVKNEIVRNFNVSQNKIVVTYEAADEFSYSKVPEGRVKEVLGKFRIHKPYILYVGNSYPYKNIDRLVESLLKIEAGVKLVIVAPRDSFLNKTIAKTQDFGLTERVIFTGSIGDSDLKVLLNQANLFVIPSLSEGFGLPGLEAMACGCPVASSNLTSLPEVYGEAAIYFNPLSVKSISEAVNKVLGSKKIAGELIKKGQEQVRKYSWEKMAKETLEIYKEINV